MQKPLDIDLSKRITTPTVFNDRGDPVAEVGVDTTLQVLAELAEAYRKCKVIDDDDPTLQKAMRLLL